MFSMLYRLCYFCNLYPTKMKSNLVWFKTRFLLSLHNLHKVGQGQHFTPHRWQCAVFDINNCCGLTEHHFLMTYFTEIVVGGKTMRNVSQFESWCCHCQYLVPLTFPLYVLLLSSQLRARACQTSSDGVREVLCAHLTASVLVILWTFYFDWPGSCGDMSW